MDPIPEHQLEPTGMRILDDGSHVQLTPEKRFHDAVAQLVQPERLPRLTQEQAEVLAIVVMDGMATRRRIEEVRGAAELSIGPEGPVSLDRDSSETLALLLSRGLLCAERDDHAMGIEAEGLPLVPGADSRKPPRTHLSLALRT